MEMNKLSLDKYLQIMAKGFQEAALWVDENESAEFTLEAEHDIDALCYLFTAGVKLSRLVDGRKIDISKINPKDLGADLFFTMNGHGTGFWDRDYADKEVLSALTLLSKRCGESYVTVDDDKAHIHIPVLNGMVNS